MQRSERYLEVVQPCRRSGFQGWIFDPVKNVGGEICIYRASIRIVNAELTHRSLQMVTCIKKGCMRLIKKSREYREM